MPVTRQPATGDPLANLARRDRRLWRETARTIQAQHDADTMARLAGLHLQPVTGILTCPPDAVAITLSGWTITMAGVAPASCANLRLLAARPSRLADSGRYGRFWWLSSRTGAPPRAVLLGHHLRLAPTEDGRRRGQSPDPATPDRTTPVVSLKVTSGRGQN